jgi:peptidoglycan/LPS O-acetylase OafA/YrhL
VVTAYLMSVYDHDKLPRIYWIILNNIVLPIPIGVCFCGLIHERSVLRSFLASRPTIFFGRVSFAFYLIHYKSPFSQFVDSIWGGFFADLVLLGGLASLLYLGIEEPLRKLLRGKRIPRLPASVVS